MPAIAKAAQRLPYDPFAVEHLTDRRRRYQLDLNPSFPFAIKLFSNDSLISPYPLNWHERLEIFIPVDGEGTFRMGHQTCQFQAGDVQVIDSLKLHGIESIHGRRRRAMVVTFAPAFVYTLGAPVCDSVFPAPFVSELKPPGRVMKAGTKLSSALHDSLAQLAECYFSAADPVPLQVGCKTYLMSVLYTLLLHFGWTAETCAAYFRKPDQSRSLAASERYLKDNFCEKVSVGQAALLVGMSETKFMEYFKSVTGETFVSYLRLHRMERVLQLLEESQESIAQIAAEVGFADQSYFDKVFYGFFHRMPSSMRRGIPGMKKEVA